MQASRMRSAVLFLLPSFAAFAQSGSHVVATVPTADVSSSAGVLEISSGKSVLGTASAVTANPTRAARVTLLRGGELEVCQGSTARLTGAGNAAVSHGRSREPLVIGLDRGALELRLDLSGTDAIMTPDLRLVSADAGTHPLDLALRVTAAGDTCVDNRGRKASPLNVSSAFNTGTYQIKPGQRVLFEHGSLREVVDREQGPCGCPAPVSTLVAGKDKNGQFPFPEAVSEGLVPPTPPSPETPGVTHTGISTTLAAAPGAEPPPLATQPAASPSPAETPDKPGFFASVGHFFQHLFAR